MVRIANLPGTRTSVIPPTLHYSNPSLYDCQSIPKENNNDFLRHRCIPRKRRVLQQPYPIQQHTQPYSDRPHPPSSPQPQPQSKLLPPNICVSTAASPNTSSPPISPKTFIPLSYPQQLTSTSTTSTTSTSPSSLRPCHICHRRPTTRGVLDAYADCDLCGQRSCYICLRQCDSPSCCGSAGLGDQNQLLRDGSDRLQEEINGDDSESKQSRRKICSCCAVEGVSETGVEIVQCLDCVRASWPPDPGQLG